MRSLCIQTKQKKNEKRDLVEELKCLVVNELHLNQTDAERSLIISCIIVNCTQLRALLQCVALEDIAQP